MLIGIALVYYLLSWTKQFQHADWTPVFIAYEDLDPFGHVERWGLYTRYGQAGAIFGAIVPLLLFAVAAYLATRLLRSQGRPAAAADRTKVGDSFSKQ